jgi:hypothetical protein
VLTAAAIIEEANERAKSIGYETQCLRALNAVLSDLAEQHDFALARGIFTFNFNPALVTMFGSGPYPLPLDYLRTSGSSGAEGVTRSAWFLYPAPAFPNGQPMPLVPVDLGRFDQYPQIDAQGIPSVIATDMGGPLTDRIVLSTTLWLNGTSTALLSSILTTTGLYAGLGVAGEGITPGTVLNSITPFVLNTTGTTTSGSAVVTGLASTTGVMPGMAIGDAGFAAIPAGAIVLSVDSATQVTMSVNATQAIVGDVISFETWELTLSKMSTQSIRAASVFFGIAPVAYVYPPPVGPYPVTIRYQRKMPPITDTSKVPWFPNEGYLIRETASRMMETSDDTRANELHMRASDDLRKYLDLSDDKTNRAQTVQLDASRYGPGSGSRLKITKVAGW